MDKLFLVFQFGLSCLAFMCVVVSVVAYTIMGNRTALGCLASFTFLFLTWKLVRLSWSEMHAELKK